MIRNLLIVQKSEGVFIRIKIQSEDEKIVLKYKQTWAVKIGEYERILQPSKVSEIEKLC